MLSTFWEVPAQKKKEKKEKKPCVLISSWNCEEKYGKGRREGYEEVSLVQNFMRFLMNIIKHLLNSAFV